MKNKDFKFYIAVPVWGRKYIDIFLNISLATLMTSDNLPFLCAKSEVNFFIYTTPEFVNEVRENVLIKELSQLAKISIKVIYIPIKEYYKADSEYHDYYSALYECKSNCYRDNIYKSLSCDADNRVIISLNADIIFSSDFMKNCYAILLNGKKAIEVVGPRGNAEQITNALLHNFFIPSKNTIDISSKDLLDLWIKNIHQLLEIHFWHGNSKYFNCSHILWPIENGSGWVARCFFLYPIVVVLPNKEINFNSTIDGDLIVNCGYTKNDVEVITNSEQIFCCELSEPDKYTGNFGERGNLKKIAATYKKYGTTYNFDLLKEKIILGHNYNPYNLKHALQETDIIINTIIDNT